MPSGSVGADGLWEGWIEFVSKDAVPIRTPRETEQPNRIALEYWATGLTAAYLEGALRRAFGASPTPTIRVPTADPSIFDEPAPEIRARPLHPVLDPFATYEQGEGILRQQLAALSGDHLLTIVEWFDLPVTRGASGTDRDLIDGIVLAVARKEGRSA